jgi:2-oxo-3-(phosphooxy)propyl 3-oxoalkanoate synthase
MAGKRGQAMSTLIADDLTNTFQLSFEQTVPRSLVHKRSLENVLLTEVRAHGDDGYVCAGRIPTAHRFFNDAGKTPQRDIMFFTELGRQASLAISHTFFGVGREDVFIFEQSEAQLKDAAWKSPRRSVDSVITEIKVREVERRKNDVVSRIVADQIMSIGGEQVFYGIGAWTIQSAALFQRLRRLSKGQSSPAAVETASNLRSLINENVVIFGPRLNADRTEFVSFLIVDQSHPYFFDHPCDHVPGMLLLEACRQTAQAAVSHTTSVPKPNIAVSGYEVSFQQFVETHLPVKITASFDPAASGNLFPETVHISISQQNVLCGTATLSVVFPS